MRAHVRFGSLADIRPLNSDVRFTPNSGHQEDRPRCPLSANSGHLDLLKLLKVRWRHGRFRARVEGSFLGANGVTAGP